MKASVIDYIWKSKSGYSYGYVLITNRHTIEQVKEDG